MKKAIAVDWLDKYGGAERVISSITKIFTINNISLIINDYHSNLFTTKLLNIDNKYNALILQQNTLISEKIQDAYSVFNLLSLIEKENIIKIYNDMPLINGHLVSMYNLLTDISELSTININEDYYIFYDIIMTIIEYNKIINGNYNFNNDSIGILIYDTSTFQKITQIPNPLDKSSLNYTFKLYRKTDLPIEYKYIFGENSKINNSNCDSILSYKNHNFRIKKNNKKENN